MPTTHRELRTAFARFWEKKNHVYVSPASLVPAYDPTTLFTSSGMQPLVQYLAGTPHPLGRRLYNIQPCFRAVDIDAVGDNRHTTFFEMMGNWSLGDYFKRDQLAWAWEFFTSVIGLPTEKLYVTVFEGGNHVPKDEESLSLWKKLGVAEDHIFQYGVEKNWWSRAGTPQEMPAGEIGGPDSEIFYQFDVEHDKRFGENCHPNCDCGRFLEIGNSVFIQYRKNAEGTLDELLQKNVDFGGGLERILAALNNDPDIFKTDVFADIISAIEKTSGKTYTTPTVQATMRVIADHMKAATFLISNGVAVSSKGQGSVVRRLLCRSMVKLNSLEKITSEQDLLAVSDRILKIYGGVYPSDKQEQKMISTEIGSEMLRFSQTLEQGLKIIDQTDVADIDEKFAFDLFQSYGFPFEVTQELMLRKGVKLDQKKFIQALKKHQELSRTSSVGMFKGGLADHSEQVIRYHTATHLLHQALRDVLGDGIRQEGSNITSERLRFDFSFDRKPSDKEIEKIGVLVNQKIKDAIPVSCKTMSKQEAEKIGARAFFKEKYDDIVKVYFIGDYSKELCGGPHVGNTSEIKSFTIIKCKKLGSHTWRIYAI